MQAAQKVSPRRTLEQRRKAVHELAPRCAEFEDIRRRVGMYTGGRIRRARVPGLSKPARELLRVFEIMHEAGYDGVHVAHALLGELIEYGERSVRSAMKELAERRVLNKAPLYAACSPYPCRGQVYESRRLPNVYTVGPVARRLFVGAQRRRRLAAKRAAGASRSLTRQISPSRVSGTQEGPPPRGGAPLGEVSFGQDFRRPVDNSASASLPPVRGETSRPPATTVAAVKKRLTGGEGDELGGLGASKARPEASPIDADGPEWLKAFPGEAAARLRATGLL